MEKMNLKTALKAGFKCNDNGYFNSFLDYVYANQIKVPGMNSIQKQKQFILHPC